MKMMASKSKRRRQQLQRQVYKCFSLLMQLIIFVDEANLEESGENNKGTLSIWVFFVFIYCSYFYSHCQWLGDKKSLWLLLLQSILH